MRYIAAYILSTLGGAEKPQAADISKILSSVGIEGSDEKIKQVIGELNGKDVSELIVKGSSKLATASSFAAVATPSAATSAAPAAAKADAKKEAAKKEESEEDMGFGLFD